MSLACIDRLSCFPDMRLRARPARPVGEPKCIDGRHACQNPDAMSSTEFDALVRAFSSDLYRFAHWLCRNRWQAQDLVQETFVAAWKNRESLRDKTATKSWLFSILRNEHVRVYQRKRLELVDTQLEDLDIAGDGGEIERVELEETLRALPENLREPLLLQVLGGFSGKEIAAMLNISEPNVMTRLTRARQTLHKLSAPGGQPAQQEA